MTTRFESLYGLPPEAVLILNRDIVIPANALAVYLQNGRVTPGGVNHYEPSCKFELRHKKTEPQRVPAGTFRIRKFTRHRGDFAGVSIAPLRPARHRRRLDLFGEDAPSFIVYASYFFLESAEQPDVLRMTCSHWQFWGEGRFLTLAEIQAALGEVFTLRLAL